MGERKVQNKYYPPDFDPSKIPRQKNSKNNAMKVRNMLPMTVRCNTCGNFNSPGTKFNMIKKDANETYLGIQIYSFTFKCTTCCAIITFKTDPRNSGYEVVSGAKSWRCGDDTQDKAGVRDEDVIKGKMECLEEKANPSKREWDTFANVDELRTRSAKLARVTPDDALRALSERNHKSNDDEKGNAEDEALIRSIYGPKEQHEYVKRINDDDEEFENDYYSVKKKLKVSEVVRVTPQFKHEFRPKKKRVQN